MIDLDDEQIIVVCDNCLRASCWNGEFMCDECYESGTTEKTVAELKKLNLEDEHHWTKQGKRFK